MEPYAKLGRLLTKIAAKNAAKRTRQKVARGRPPGGVRPPRAGGRNRLRAARERLGLTQPELARRLGLTRLYVQAVEVGRRGASYATMVRWARELGEPLEIFAPDEGYSDAAE
jgi:DNA-binding XRE family transcriptional regulator